MFKPNFRTAENKLHEKVLPSVEGRRVHLQSSPVQRLQPHPVGVNPGVLGGHQMKVGPATHGQPGLGHGAHYSFKVRKLVG